MLKQTLVEAYRLVTSFLHSNKSEILNASYSPSYDAYLDTLYFPNHQYSIRGEFLLNLALKSTIGTSEMDQSSMYSEVLYEDNLNSQQTLQLEHCAEEDVLRELLFAFNGVNGHLFEKQLDSSSIKFLCKIQTFPSVHQHACHLLELGSLRLAVQQVVDSVPTVGGTSLCLAALTNSLRLCLNKFSYLLSQLEAELLDGGSTMLRFRVQLAKPMQQMKWFATVVHYCQTKRGGAVLSALDELMQHGDQRVSDILQPLFSEVAIVFYQMLDQWLRGGKFYDPHLEFFITTNDSSDAKYYWAKDYYCIRKQVLPTFISDAQAQALLQIGTSVALLQKIVGLDKVAHRLRILDAALKSATFCQIGRTAWETHGVMSTCIAELLQAVSMQLVHVMLNNGKLLMHLHTLAGFLLLKQGRFARELLARLGSLLDQPVKNITVHQLALQLQSAIHNSCPKLCDTTGILCIHIKLLPSTNANSFGWDVFTLEYVISDDNPICLVITAECREKYTCLFKKLLKAKRIQWVLFQLLISVKTLWRLFLSKQVEAVQDVQTMHLLASDMHYVMQQLDYYLHYMQVERQWNRFQAFLDQASSLDFITSAHLNFLDTLSNEEDCAKLNLAEFYDLVLQLQNMCNDVLAYTKESSSLGQENSESVRDILSGVHNLKTNFDRWMQNCLTTLRSSPKELQDLIIHLNFNDYYKIETS